MSTFESVSADGLSAADTTAGRAEIRRREALAKNLKIRSGRFIIPDL
jgi:hypothetical protein